MPLEVIFGAGRGAMEVMGSDGHEGKRSVVDSTIGLEPSFGAKPT